MKKAETRVAQERDANGRRDRELVRLVGRHGAMTVAQVMLAMDCGRTVTYGRVARCLDGGLIERTALPGASSSILHATRQGLTYARLGLPVAGISPASIEHLLRCTSVAVRLERNLGPDRVLTEREIVLEEQIEDRPIASVKMGEFQGRPRMHRADLAVRRESGLVAVEVELTPKSPARLRRIIEKWAGEVKAGRLSEVHYLCEPGSQTWRAVDRAIEKAVAKSGVHLAEVPS